MQHVSKVLRGTKAFGRKISVMSLSAMLVLAQLAPVVAALVVVQNERVDALEICVNDQQGANDEPGQKDLTRFCEDSSINKINWNWDELSVSGNNTLDGCALFDTDGDGSANKALCISTTDGDPFIATIYTCNDSRIDRCAGADTGSVATSACSVAITNTQPFSSGDSSPQDLTATCYPSLSDTSGGDLIDVCSYPSGQPNSDPSDCIVIKNKDSAKIEVRKVVVPSNDNGLFNLLISGNVKASNVGNGGTTGEVIYDAATRTISETAGTGTVLSNYSTNLICKDGNGTGQTLVNADSTSAQVQIAAGSDVVCTFTNTRLSGTITLVKNVVNDNGGTATANDFGLSIGGQSVTSGQTLTLSPGTYAINEAGLAGYQFTGISGTGCPAQLGGTVTLANNQNITCTITNNDIAPSLTLIKNVTNNNGGQRTASEWTLNATGSVQSPTNLSGAGGATSGASFKADTYTLSEAGPSDYTQGIWTCVGGTQNGSAITVGIGQTATCSITNDDKPATLRVIKKVINDNGGTLQSPNFTMLVSGTNPSQTSFAGSSTGVDVTIDAGSYSVDESAVNGYAKTLGANCSGTIANGQTVECVITNDDAAPKLTVIKTVVNDNGGLLAVSNFPLFVGNVSVTSGVQNTFNTGVYVVSETNQAGYTAGSWGGDCNPETGSISMALGGVYTCTITNNDQPGTLIVKKVVINDNGGTATADDFSYKVNNGSSTFFEVDGENNQIGENSQTVNRGLYTIVEDAAAGYATTYENCSAVLVENGGTTTCTITNNDIAPSLTLVKDVQNGQGGQLNANAWTLSATGASQSPTNISGNGQVSSGVGFKADTYTLAESFVSDAYSASSWSCTNGVAVNVNNQITLANGTSTTCTITNTFKEVDLSLDKDDDGVSTEAGDTYDYAINVDNNAATFAATEVQVTDTLDGFLKFESYSGTDWTCVLTGEDVNGFGGTLTCDYAKEIPAGGSAAELTITVSVSDEIDIDEIDNSATVTSKEYELDEDDNSDDETTPVKSISVLAEAVCVNDFPYLRWSVTATNFAPTQFVLDWFTTADNQAGDPEGTLEATQTFQALDLTYDPVTKTYSAETLWPGADTALPDWPGWDFVSGVWIENPNDLGGNLRPSANVVITANPTEDEVEVYPPATPDCNPNPPATITLVKEVVNDNGGDATEADWTLSATGSAQTVTGTSGSTEVTNVSVAVGTDENVYTLSESGSMQGYAASNWVCDENAGNVEGYEEGKATLDGDQLTLQAGANVTCTITNDDIPPTIIVSKSVNSINNETQTFEFEIDNNGMVLPFEITVDADEYSDSITLNEELSAGSIEIKELAKEDWENDYLYCESEGYDDGVYGTTSFTVQLGRTYYCYAGNSELSTVVVTKFHDIDEDGEWDEDEPTLPDWTMNLASEKCKYVDVRVSENFVEDNYIGCDGVDEIEVLASEEDEKLSEVTNQDGEAIFNEVSSGYYELSEDLQDGWDWSNTYCDYENGGEGQIVYGLDNLYGLYVAPGQTLNCFVGNHRTPELLLEKANDSPLTERGNEVVYTLTVTVPEAEESGRVYGDLVDECFQYELSEVREIVIDLPENCYTPVTVTDLPPENIDYIPGSFTATSNVRGNLKAQGITTEPTYASPGDWSLTNLLSPYLVPGEVITLTYRALVGNQASNGEHPDTAFARGYDAVGETVLANESTGIFRSTAVEIVGAPAPAGSVLGATTTLVETGSGVLLQVVVGAAIITLAVVVTRRTKSAQMVKVMVVAVSFGAVVWGMGATASAFSSLNVQTPQSPTRVADFSLAYQVMTTDQNTDFSAELWVNGVLTDTQAITEEYGDSSAFNVTLPGDGSYNLEVKVTSTSGEAFAQTVAKNVVLDRVSPSVPQFGGVTTSGTQSTVRFTVPAGSDAATAQIYAATTPSFTLTDANRVGEVATTAGTEQAFTFTLPTNERYYVAVVALDAAGNVSPAASEPGVIVQVVQAPGGGVAAGGAAGGAAAAGAGGVVAGAETAEGTDTGEVLAGQVDEESAEATTSGSEEAADDESGSDIWWYVLAAIVVAGGGYYGYRLYLDKKSNSKK